MDRRLLELISADHGVHSQELPLQTARSIQGLRMVDEASLAVRAAYPATQLCLIFVCVHVQVYPDPVRVVSVAVPVSDLLVGQSDRQTSVELCCGT